MMQTYGSQWYDRIRARFGERDVLDAREAYARFWPDADTADLNSFFLLLEQEYRLPAGFFRPDDPVTHLTDAVPTRNPLRWLAWQPKTELTVDGLEWELLWKWEKRRNVPMPRMRTIDDMVRVWCGLDPRDRPD